MRFIICVLVGLSWLSAEAQSAAKGDKPQLTKQALPPWQTFRVDEHLELQLPVPARQVASPSINGRSMQAYQATASDAVFLIMRTGVSVAEASSFDQSGQQDNLYTGLTQAMLTTMQGVRVSQAAFHVGKFEGLAVQFRMDKAAPLALPKGTMWVLRVGASVYLLYYLPLSPAAEDATAVQNRFLASLVANDAPYIAPVPADWARFKTGRFRYLDPLYQAVTITRTDTTQTEVDTARDMQIVYRLRWTAEGYELNQLSSTFPNGAAMQGKPIKVRITAIQGDTCAYQGNLGGLILTGYLERVRH